MTKREVQRRQTRYDVKNTARYLREAYAKKRRQFEAACLVEAVAESQEEEEENSSYANVVGCVEGKSLWLM
jgi:hypothetical protein